MKIINTSFIVLMSFLFISPNALSQKVNSVIDSLETQLLVHPSKDTLRVSLLNELAYLHYNKDEKKALEYLDESKIIADSIDFKKGRAKSLYVKGLTKAFQSNFDEGFKLMNEALELFKTIDNKPGIAECYNGMGLLFHDKGELKLAVEYYEKSIKVNESIGNKEEISASFNSIGISLTDMGNYSQAINYLKKALKISQEINNENRISRCFSNIGSVYNEQGNYPLALEYYNKSLSIDERLNDILGISKSLNNIGIIHKKLQNYDKAIASYEKALKIQKKSGNKKNIIEILNNLGNVYNKKENYQTALKFLEEALKISKEINKKIYTATILNNIGEVHLQLKNDIIAFEYFIKAEKINIEVENPRGLCNSYLGITKVYLNQKKYEEALINALNSQKLSIKLKIIDYQRDAQQLLSEIYLNTNDYKKAFESHQQYKILNDSLFDKEKIEKISQLESEYKYKQQLDSASIRELQLKKTVTATNIDLEKTKQNYLWAIIGVLLVSIILGSIIFYLKLRNIRAKTQNIVVEQKLLRSQMTPHFIFNSLSVLQGMILNKEEKKSIIYLSKFSKLLRLTLENSRDKTVSLSEELKAIENYLDLQNLENDLYTYKITVNDNIDKSIFKIPPMLIQPFVENAIEHAFKSQIKNRKIEIHLTYVDEYLTCTILDNGIGVDAKKENKNQHKKSLSTTITTERLKILSKDFKMKGSVSIEDRKKFNEQGTKVTLIIPCKTFAA